MKRELFLYSLLPYLLLIVFILGLTVETAWIINLHDNKHYDTKHTNEIFKRDTSNAMHEDHSQEQHEPEIPTKLSTSNGDKEKINTKLNRRDLLEELEKIKKRLSSESPQQHQVTESESKGPSVQVTSSPTSTYEKLSYSTKTYASSVNDFEHRPDHLVPIKQEVTNIPLEEIKLHQNKMNKNLNNENNGEAIINIERSNQRSQETHPSEPRIYSQHDDELGSSKVGDAGGDGKSGRKSVNEVYGLAVKVERKYEESTEKCGRVKFSEMSAELMSEMERTDRVGNVKFEDPTVKDCLTRWSSTRESREASDVKSDSGSKLGTAPVSDPLLMTSEDKAGLLRRTGDVNQLRKRSGEGGDDGGEVDVDEDDAVNDGDVAVPLIGNRHPALGRPSID